NAGVTNAAAGQQQPPAGAEELRDFGVKHVEFDLITEDQAVAVAGAEPQLLLLAKKWRSGRQGEAILRGFAVTGATIIVGNGGVHRVFQTEPADPRTQSARILNAQPKPWPNIRVLIEVRLRAAGNEVPRRGVVDFKVSSPGDVVAKRLR